MPVTAKLSKAFYDRLGEEVTNELVEWFNQVDATYRTDLRNLNELNFQRFDAKLEQRLAQLESRVEQRIAQSEAKVGGRLVRFEAQVEQRFAQVEAHAEKRFAQIEATLERRLAEQTRWLFLMWATLLIPIIGLWIRG